ncbi:MAG: hypothetical protein ACKVZH_23990 [Blastocatellia bacterium]
MKFFSLKTISAVSILCLMAAAFVVAQPRQRPNIIFILADDLGRGDWRVYGHERLKKPTLGHARHVVGELLCH